MHASLVGPLIGPATGGDGRGFDWRRSGERLLVVSSGTVFERSAHFFRAIIDEFADRAEWAVIMATSRADPALLGRLPTNILAQQWIPQRELLDEATLFITHGGINSVHEALLAGVPMLLSPRIREQRRTSLRLQQMGVGELLPSSGVRATAERLAGDRRMRDRLARVQDRALAARGAERAADILLAVWERNRRAPTVASAPSDG
ncbi:nucleotide disphospho-sugar-binding domain-containing protein [Nocardia yunnanensis]|nr:nucleotide disphospho-sugar-binding domain-containing protein [Nocardia yunnanensis]